jgi:hypothetical protein
MFVFAQLFQKCEIDEFVILDTERLINSLYKPFAGKKIDSMLTAFSIKITKIVKLAQRAQTCFRRNFLVENWNINESYIFVFIRTFQKKTIQVFQFVTFATGCFKNRVLETRKTV